MKKDLTILIDEELILAIDKIVKAVPDYTVSALCEEMMKDEVAFYYKKYELAMPIVLKKIIME